MAGMQAGKAEKSKPLKIEFKQSIFKLLQSYLSHQLFAELTDDAFIPTSSTAPGGSTATGYRIRIIQ